MLLDLFILIYFSFEFWDTPHDVQDIFLTLLSMIISGIILGTIWDGGDQTRSFSCQANTFVISPALLSLFIWSSFISTLILCECRQGPFLNQNKILKLSFLPTLDTWCSIAHSINIVDV